MKKVILMAAVAMLFVGTAAAQGKVTKTNSGVSTTTTTTVAKPNQGPKANQAAAQGKKDMTGTTIKGCNNSCNNHAKESANCNKACTGKKDNTSTTIKTANGTAGKDNKVQK